MPGETVILDNGAYEVAEWNPHRYLQLVEDLRPQVVTLPDKVGDARETARLIRDFAGACRERRSMPIAEVEHMVVVQHHPEASLAEWMWEYDQLGHNFCDWIAFPRILGNRRVELIAGLQKLGKWWEGLRHHAFGMNAGSLVELPQLNALGVYSCDSSAPVWRGLCGFRNGDPSWPDVKFDPYWNDQSNEAMARKQVGDRNLAEVLEACQQKSEMPSPIKAARMW